MPISNQQFNSGLDDTPQKILDFLQKNKANGAYTVAEVMKGIGRNEPNVVISVLAYIGFDSFLKEMASKKMIEIKTVNGQEYYGAK